MEMFWLTVVVNVVAIAAIPVLWVSPYESRGEKTLITALMAVLIVGFWFLTFLHPEHRLNVRFATPKPPISVPVRGD